MNILAIETSFDETAAAIVKDGKTILANVTATSNLLHRKYGGVVPEVAARKQVESMIPVLIEVLQGMTSNDVDALAVTVGPGLIGSLLIGVETVKTLALAWNKPIIPVNHVLAHMYSNFVLPAQSKFQISNSKFQIKFPAISLVVSGGHTELYLMTDAKTLKWLGGTLDDAAGEAFDKSARLLGFENKGGAAIEAAAAKFQISNFKFQIKLPRPMLHDKTLNFSFSGLKTALLREVKKLKAEQQFDNTAIQQLSFEVQEAIADVQVIKTLRAAEQFNAKSILLSGGVAANKRLREKFNLPLTAYRLPLFAPQRELCTDNAIMIAACAYFLNKQIPWQEITAQPNLTVEI